MHHFSSFHRKIITKFSEFKGFSWSKSKYWKTYGNNLWIIWKNKKRPFASFEEYSLLHYKGIKEGKTNGNIPLTK